MAVGNWEPESHLDRMDWDWYNYDYRIKPEPMEIEVWVGKHANQLALRAEDGHSYLQGGTEDSWAKDWTKKKFREVLDE